MFHYSDLVRPHDFWQDEHFVFMCNLNQQFHIIIIHHEPEFILKEMEKSYIYTVCVGNGIKTARTLHIYILHIFHRSHTLQIWIYTSLCQVSPIVTRSFHECIKLMFIFRFFSSSQCASICFLWLCLDILPHRAVKFWNICHTTVTFSFSCPLLSPGKCGGWEEGSSQTSGHASGHFFHSSRILHFSSLWECDKWSLHSTCTYSSYLRLHFFSSLVAVLCKIRTKPIKQHGW